MGKDREVIGNIGRSLLVCMTTLILFALAGCAPVISRSVLKEADPSVRFEQVLMDPDAYRGTVLLLGGEIIKTENYPEKTTILVLQRLLGFRNKPVSDSQSKGRFIVVAPGFLDPAIYRPRRKITVVGTVAGKEIRPLGELEYAYPVIDKKEVYIWPPEATSAGEPRFYFGFGIGTRL